MTMIRDFELNNLGPIKNIKANSLSNINLFIGLNGSGKTFLLKTLYVVKKSVEQYRRGKEQRSLNELIHDKLYWTYQPNKIGDIVSKGASKLEVSVDFDKSGGNISFSFGVSTAKSITSLNHTVETTSANSIFFPAKEILSLQSVILESRSDRFNSFGFDDTYYDLAKALTPAQKGKNYKIFSDARCELSEAINGRIYFDSEKKEWYFKNNEGKEYNIGSTAEGIKKVSILDALLGNHYLSKNSVIFLDEPESSLHPELVSKLMDIIYDLSRLGIQFFIATHSYFVIKKLYLLAHQKKVSIPIFSLQDGIWVQNDLFEGMPNNPIIEESIKLYEEEIAL